MLVESKSFKSEKLELKIEDNQRSFFTTAGKSLYKVTINVGLWDSNTVKCEDRTGKFLLNLYLLLSVIHLQV